MAAAKLFEWTRSALAVLGLISFGYWFGSGSAVRADSSSANGVQFQLTGVSDTSSLLVYQPSEKSVYVYRGATAGNATVQCSFKFILGTPGGAVQRVNCPVGSAFR